MKAKIFLSIMALGVFVSAFGQNTIELTFTAIDSAAYVQLNSVKVMNRTQGCDTVLFYPDTVLVLGYQVGISEINSNNEIFHVLQNFPNPVINQTTVSLFIPEEDEVSIIITDMLGRIILNSYQLLDKGMHSFKFTPGEGNLYFLTAQWRGSSSSIKILHVGSYSNGESSLKYSGSGDYTSQLKATEDVQNFSFSLGDELLYVGFASDLQSGILDAPYESCNYTFQFATNIPCPGTSVVEYEGQVYNTIQLFSQCWLQENLNVGTKISGENSMSNNGLIEKYCYNNSEDSCSKYGGLYSWGEMMQYSSTQGTQGICPSGWHIPTDEEWKILEGSVDSYYNIGDDYWDAFQSRGINAGTNLKSLEGWNNNGNGNNMFGFTALPGGARGPEGLFYTIRDDGFWWTSSKIGTDKIYRKLIYQSGIYRLPITIELGLSVRCMKD